MQNRIVTDGCCRSAEDILLFIAGELPEQEMQLVKLHLGACAACRKEADGFNGVISALKKDVVSGAKCDVADAVMARIAGDASGKMARVILFGWANLLRAAALLAVALTLGILVSRSLGPARRIGTDAELAVSDAAGWLISVQEKDGSWNPVRWAGRKELGAGLTGLAMLTVMRSNLDADEQLRKAEKYLLSVQNKDGSFGPRCAGSMYNQGIATKALLELRKRGTGMAGSELDSAVACILKQQLPDGGWRYREDDSRDSSVGVSVWQLDALRAGREAGIKGLDRGLRNGLAWLSGIYGGSGDFTYRATIDDGNMSATVKAMGASLLSPGMDVPGMFDPVKVRSALAGAMNGPQDNDVYKSYFIASAAKNSGGEGLAGKLAGMRDAIVKRRITEGVNAGSWDADVKWGSVGGRIYSTAMAALALSNGNLGEI